MLKLARGSSNFSVSSIDYDRPSRPRKEAQKRKNVHFDDEPEVIEVEHFTMSTSTFLHQKGMAWNSLARNFGCEEDVVKDDSIVMNELLNLCSFWAESEPLFAGFDDEQSDETDDSDSDDDLECLRRLAMFSSSNAAKPTSPAPCSSSSSGVSSLRLNSLLRLNSQSCRASMNSSETLSRLSRSPFSCSSSQSNNDCDDCIPIKKRSNKLEQLENAFLGIMEDDNDASDDSMFPTTAASDDFWSQVEF